MIDELINVYQLALGERLGQEGRPLSAKIQRCDVPWHILGMIKFVWQYRVRE